MTLFSVPQNGPREHVPQTHKEGPNQLMVSMTTSPQHYVAKNSVAISQCLSRARAAGPQLALLSLS